MKHSLMAIALALALIFLVAPSLLRDPAVAKQNSTTQKALQTVQSLRVQVLSTMLSFWQSQRRHRRMGLRRHRGS
jgi:hypothetical protein